MALITRNATPLAWRNFSHDRARLIGSVAGVAFAVLLMFVEMGFLKGLYDNHTQFVDRLNADLLIVHADKEAVVPQQAFPRRRLTEVRGQEGVAAVYAVRVEEMRAAFKNSGDGHEYPMFVIGIDPTEPVFNVPEVMERSKLLVVPDTILLDSEAKPFFNDPLVGQTGEIAGRRLRIVGTFPFGPDFRADGTGLVSERTFLNLFPNGRNGGTAVDRVDFGLIKLQPGVDASETRKNLESILPTDVRVLTKDEFSDRIRAYWGASKPVGAVFGMGMAVGFLIGVVVCYQILYTGIVDHLPQYATIKAMGYSDAFLIRLVLEEATWLGLGGFIPGMIISTAVYAALEFYTYVPMRITFERSATVFVLTLTMCVVSALIAVRKAIEADPAEVF
jgi:putative ABC transport system permease protein